MAALRRRKLPPVQPSDPPRTPAPSKAVPPSPISTDDWQVPKKVARRKGGRGSSFAVAPLTPSPPFLKIASMADETVCQSGSREPKADADMSLLAVVEPMKSMIQIPVQLASSGPLCSSLQDLVTACRSGTCMPVGVEGGLLGSETSLVSVPIFSENSGTKVSNPFGSGGLCLGTSHSLARGDGLSGPSKRARPVEAQSQRITSKASKAKGKGPIGGKAKENGSFTFSASSESSRNLEGLIRRRLQ